MGSLAWPMTHGIKPSTRGKIPRGDNRLARKIDAGDIRPQPNPRERIRSDMAVKMHEPQTSYRSVRKKWCHQRQVIQHDWRHCGWFCDEFIGPIRKQVRFSALIPVRSIRCVVGIIHFVPFFPALSAIARQPVSLTDDPAEIKLRPQAGRRIHSSNRYWHRADDRLGGTKVGGSTLSPMTGCPMHFHNCL